MSENPTGPQPRLFFEIELPGVYTADLEELTEAEMKWQAYDDDPERAELEAFLQALRVSPEVGVRAMFDGEKESDMMTIKGIIRKIRLEEPE